jgi:putative acetyltransferase
METDVIIREIAEEDNFPLAKMIRSVFEEHDAPKQGTVYSDPTTDNLYALFQHPASKLWVAVVDGRAQGCCGIYPTEGLEAGYVELVKFYVSTEVRGKGIGKALMMKSIQSAQELGYNYLYIESCPQFAKAVSMYEKLGFETLERPLGSSNHCSCPIWMLKNISTTPHKYPEPTNKYQSDSHEHGQTHVTRDNKTVCGCLQ